MIHSNYFIVNGKETLSFPDVERLRVVFRHDESGGGD